MKGNTDLEKMSAEIRTRQNKIDYRNAFNQLHELKYRDWKENAKEKVRLCHEALQNDTMLLLEDKSNNRAQKFDDTVRSQGGLSLTQKLQLQGK